MARFQVRTGENTYLEDVVDRMAENAWKILETWHFFDPPHPAAQDYRRFHDTIQKTISDSVRAYKLCGLSNVCLENLESTPLAASSHAMDANPTDKIYHLFPRTSLKAFLDELTLQAMTSIEEITKPDIGKQTYSALHIVFEAILGEYLYWDPICGKTEFCVLSSSAPIEIWQDSLSRSRR